MSFFSGMKSPWYRLKNLPARNITVLVFVFAFLLYANTIRFGYVYDDLPFIAENSMVRNANYGSILKSSYTSNNEIKTNVNYRPLTKMLYALEWQIAPGNPGFAHFVNVPTRIYV